MEIVGYSNECIGFPSIIDRNNNENISGSNNNNNNNNINGNAEVNSTVIICGMIRFSCSFFCSIVEFQVLSLVESEGWLAQVVTYLRKPFDDW